MTLEKPCFILIDPELFEDQPKDDIDKFITDQQAQNTKYNTKFAINVFVRFCKENNEGRSLSIIPKKEIDKLLCNFFMTVKKQDGNEYEPDSLSSIHRGIQRFIEQTKLPFNILTDFDFERSRKVLTAKRKQLTKLGKGNKPNATRELQTHEIDKLFSKGYFGTKDAQTLQRTMWWHISLHFGFRARDESRKLKWGDINT